MGCEKLIRRFSLASAAALFVTTSLLPQVQASEPPDSAQAALGSEVGAGLDDPNGLSEQEALMADAGFYARDYGVSLDEAYARLIFQRSADAALEDLATVVPETYAGVLTTHEPTFGVTIYLAGDRELGAAQDLVDEFAATQSFPIRIDTNRKLTEAAVEALLVEQRQALVDGVDGDVQGFGYDLARDEVFIQAVAPDGEKRPDAHSVFSLATSNGEQIEIPVRVEFTTGFATDGYRGGFTMTSCTAGFNIVVNGVRGMTTAAHCTPDAQQYRTFASSTWISTVFKAQTTNKQADIQWNTTGNTPGWAFHGPSTTSTQSVTSRTLRTSQAGDYICHRGKTTQYSCGTVISVSYTPSWSGACGSTPCNPLWVMAQGPSLKCNKGDSGGPVFSGGSAYGWYKGQMSTGNTPAACSWMTWMAPDYLGGAISGASILMAP